MVLSPEHKLVDEWLKMMVFRRNAYGTPEEWKGGKTLIRCNLAYGLWRLQKAI